MNAHRTGGYPQEATPSTGAGATQGCRWGEWVGCPLLCPQSGPRPECRLRVPPWSRTLWPWTPTWVMEPRYVMGLSEGTRVLGVPLVMLPPGTEPRDVPGRHETQGLRAGPRATPAVLLVTCKLHPLHSWCLNAESPAPKGRDRHLGREAAKPSGS